VNYFTTFNSNYKVKDIIVLLKGTKDQLLKWNQSISFLISQILKMN